MYYTGVDLSLYDLPVHHRDHKEASLHTSPPFLRRSVEWVGEKEGEGGVRWTVEDFTWEHRIGYKYLSLSGIRGLNYFCKKFPIVDMHDYQCHYNESPIGHFNPPHPDWNFPSILQSWWFLLANPDHCHIFLSPLPAQKRSFSIKVKIPSLQIPALTIRFNYLLVGWLWLNSQLA